MAFKILPARSVSSDSVPAKDEEVCAALEGLKIAQSSHQMSTNNVENQNDVKKVKDAESDCHVKAQAEGVVKERHVIDDDDDDDVVVVRPDHTPRVRTLGEFYHIFMKNRTLRIYLILYVALKKDLIQNTD